MCGLCGIVAQKDVNHSLYEALNLLQHRGQDAAGIVTCQEGHFFQRRGTGLVRDIFQEEHILRLVGDMGLGHVRYPTTGSLDPTQTQPLYVNSPYGIMLAHNGNLTNTRALQKDLSETDHRHLNTGSDSEVLLNLLARELSVGRGLQPTVEDIFKAVAAVHRHCRGAYAVVALLAGHGILGFRDPHGIRPLVFGRRETMRGMEYMITSESVALEALDFELERDVAPGEAVYIEWNGTVHTRQCAESPHLSPCIFEHVYLARPDSIMDRVSVYKARLRQGEYLARNIERLWGDVEIDVVIPVPDTGRVAAQTIAEQLKLKFREGLMKNRYSGRTFIMPGQEQRDRGVRQKLNPITLEFHNRNVLLVDDSIVRGTTSRQIIDMARSAGARRVYFVSAAPPVRHPNVYGIDMPTRQELVACGRSEEEVRAWLGADRLMYQSLEDLVACSSEGNPEIPFFECSVFDGHYITGDVDEQYLRLLAQQRGVPREAPSLI